MRIGNKRCLICSCEGTMPIDAQRLATALGADAPPRVHHHLCRSDMGALQEAMAEPGTLILACRQETALFAELMSGEDVRAELRTVDIRNAAGWCKKADHAAPKQAALLAEAALDAPEVPGVVMQSSGRCLVLGDTDIALPAAERLAAHLVVTLVCESLDDPPPRQRGITLLRGRVVSLSGHLGAFATALEDVAMATPSSRAELAFEAPQERFEATFDLVLDLRHAGALVTAPDKRDGYFKVDPGDPLAVERVLFDIVQLQGSFEKPRYIDYKSEFCAHSRSSRIGCHRCLDNCPTGAVTPNGDHVALDPFVCAGCGACAGLCPSGAITYASPPPNHLMQRLRTLLRTYLEAGGENPVILVHDLRHGEPMIDALARHGDGLPPHVIPIVVEEPTQLGMEVLACAIAYGAHAVRVLLPWRAAPEALALEASIGFTEAVMNGLGMGEGRVQLLLEDDPDRLGEALWGLKTAGHQVRADFLPLGGKRERLRLALDALHAAAENPPEVIALPPEAPMGNVEIDIEGCTLCLACVGACPTGALVESPDQPMLRFVEDACIQCGLCRSTCPEKVIRLEPRVNFSSEAKSPRLIKEEEPFHCVRCGQAFGTKSTVEKIIGALATRHSMFQSEEQIARLSMCDDCRVRAQFEAKDNPFAIGPKPKTRTTEDYLREREEIEAARKAHESQNKED